MPNNTSNNSPGDVFTQGSRTHNSTEGNTARQSNVDTDLLRDIDSTLKDILDNMGNMSQSAARGAMPGDRKDANRWRTNRRSGKLSNDRTADDLKHSSGSFMNRFTDGIEDALLDSLGASDFKKQIQGSLSNLAKQLNVSVEELPNTLGKELGNELANTKIGKAITSRIKNFTDRAMSNMTDAFESGKSAGSLGKAIRNGFSKGFNRRRNQSATSPDAQNMQDTVDQASNVSDTIRNATQSNSNVVNFPGANAASAPTSTATLAEGADAAMAAGQTVAAEGAAAAGTSAASAMSGLASAAASAIGPMLAASAALFVIDKAFDTLAPAIEGTKKLFKSMSRAANRYEESRKKNLEFEKERIRADVNAMIEAPFKILEDAAQNLYDAWDNQIKQITSGQGYNKEDVQSLMRGYAERLRDEGLTNVISGSDIMDNLSKVIESGLSGQVAEEFAYLATKLNAAVPTQDFFSYADTYASVAANAIRQGKSQSEAIAYANAEMETFASNVLYASRQLSGGFSTGLKDAQQLFNYSVQIANASKEGDAALISGVLTSVSAITGAVAPDLAGSLVETIVKAATGGNSSEIVALRSLAGINASNTEFLKALAKNPQGIFTTLFSNLAKMQNMSNDNFMEVAEGLSSVFGISMDAFARVDFNYLANAISQMNVNNASLNENMELLVSGQTTTTAEQMRMAQINQYMLEEGLAYVLDNEVARQIQQHMWDEQIARELQEASYAVELQGSALEFLESIKQTVSNIVNFLNPFSWFKKLFSIGSTKKQADALNADTLKLLELGKVGSGDPTILYNLMTTNKNLQLTPSITELMGGFSQYQSARSAMNDYFAANVGGAVSGYSNPWDKAIQEIAMAQLKEYVQSTKTNSPDSKYTWGTVRKSTYAALTAPAYNATGISSSTQVSTQSTADVVKAKSNSNFEKFLETIEDVTKADSENKMGYEEWLKTSTKFGISDVKKAIEDYGMTEAELKGKFGDSEAEAASEYKYKREEKEEEFWKQATMFALNTQEKWLTWESLIADNQTSMISQLVKANIKLQSIYNKAADFLSSWTAYYIDHSAYSSETMSAYKAADIIKAEQKENGDAVTALAEALTANTIGVTEGFKDPVVQTNVLLSKILLVAQAIMNQNNTTGGLTIPDTYAALALGATLPTT